MPDAFLADLRYSLRALLARPGFSLAALLTLGIGIGANAAIFSVLDGALFRPLPFPHAERLVDVRSVYPQMGLDDAGTSIPDYLDRRAAPALEDLAIYTGVSLALAEQGGPERLAALRVSPSLFSVLSTRPALGRGFSDADAVPGAAPVVVLGHATWQARFDGDPAILGRRIRLDGSPYEVVGVMPEGFFFPNRETALFVPFAWTAEEAADTARGNEYSRAVGRLREGASIAQLDAQLAAIIAANAERIGGLAEPGASDFATFLRSGAFLGRGVPLREQWLGSIAQTLWLLQGATLLLLLIACANVGNLMLTRALARRRELTVRSALGASRWRLACHLFAEALLLSSAGAALGLAFAAIATPLLAAALGFDPEVGLFGFGVDLRVVAFAAALAVATALAFGLLPLLGHSGGRAFQALREGARGGGEGRGARLLRAAMVSLQTAVALTLLVCGGLLLRSFAKLSEVDPGFDTTGVTTATVQLPKARYPDHATRAAFFGRALETVRAEPGLSQAGLITGLPFSTQFWTSSFRIEGFTTPPGGAGPHGHFRIVDERYFDTVRVPLLRGRWFDVRDVAGAAQVVVIDQLLADKYFPGRDPIGQRLTQDGDQVVAPSWWTVVGVVGTVNHGDLSKAATKETYYRPYAQQSADMMSIVVRSELGGEQVAAGLRRALAKVDPELPLFDVRALDERVALSLGTRRASTQMLVVFAALALTLAAVGLYGILSFAVGARRGELGVRMAIGARRGDVVRLMLGHGLRLGAIGAAVGLVGAMAAARVIDSQLFGVGSFDVAVYLVVLAVLGSVLLLASWLPARRAGRADPLEALRHE
ncbi:MAG: ABC transporter permease [Xanthomonadaceae bacterium]|jgi:predicted permease|nr:ABC transporter permease [Xanthomonadaceae bacterium]